MIGIRENPRYLDVGQIQKRLPSDRKLLIKRQVKLPLRIPCLLQKKVINEFLNGRIVYTYCMISRF